ncbi:hypothetical protein FLX08_26000 [Microbispora hainanensis]|uniref:Uncharacterized protein n=1 Tax=Microbispora hainanensis TaxID=568844 RepID=A0A544YN49_9ACTN|nr:hypothetical protein FLX08_26000 [Microbispora hainanensis]
MRVRCRTTASTTRCPPHAAPGRAASRSPRRRSRWPARSQAWHGSRTRLRTPGRSLSPRR